MPLYIANKVVSGGTVTNIPAHLSFGQYIIDQLRDKDDALALVSFYVSTVSLLVTS